MKPYISLIIPVYNVEQYLRECLDSILKWSFTDWEAILINDGSLDGSGIICEEYVAIDSRFKVIHKLNEGVSVARNVGLDLAQGEWCWFVDADDIIDSGTPVEFETLRNKDIVMFDIISFNNGESIPVQFNDGRSEICTDLEKFYMKYISWAHTSIWFHRIFWEKNGKYNIRFSKGIRLGEDGEFMRKCEFLSKHPIKIDYINYYYRQHVDSATHTSDKNNIALYDSFVVLRNLYEFINTHNVEPARWRSYRIATIAKSIPLNAVVSGVWNKQLYKKFNKLIQDFDSLGFSLRSYKAIWLSVELPWLYWVYIMILKR